MLSKCVTTPQRRICQYDAAAVQRALSVSELLAELKACSISRNLERGRSLHEAAIRSGDVRVANTLINMYAKCGCMQDARWVFQGLKNRTVISWNALILGYAESGESLLALDLFSKLRLEGEPDERTFLAVFKACANLAGIQGGNSQAAKAASREKGKALHLLSVASGCNGDIRVKATLVHLYAKCGSMEDARRIFDRIERPNIVLWNALLLGYAENGESARTLSLFWRMQREGCEPDQISFMAALRACGFLAALDTGMRIHADIHRRRFKHDVILANCLVDFYAKCGSLAEAEQVFDKQPTRTIVTWTALMAGYSRSGDTGGVFRIFDRMLDTGLQPSGVTLLCVLTACSHAGLVSKGRAYFEAMEAKYDIQPDVDHYTCMVDILGRGKQLDEAMALLRNMPFIPNTSTWLTVLAACRKWKNVELARVAFQSLQDKSPGAYVLMANVYASRGMWTERALMQDMRSQLGISKTPGQSCWTDRSGLVNTFFSGDKVHNQSSEIHDKLQELLARMREHGYSADLSSVTRDLPDAEKEEALWCHSERLAIACALINTGPGETIRIIKNLRICDDCHVATGFISKLEGRTILCRDASRFHVFKDGKCSSQAAAGSRCRTWRCFSFDCLCAFSRAESRHRRNSCKASRAEPRAVSRPPTSTSGELRASLHSATS